MALFVAAYQPIGGCKKRNRSSSSSSSAASSSSSSSSSFVAWSSCFHPLLPSLRRRNNERIRTRGGVGIRNTKPSKPSVNNRPTISTFFNYLKN